MLTILIILIIIGIMYFAIQYAIAILAIGAIIIGLTIKFVWPALNGWMRRNLTYNQRIWAYVIGWTLICAVLGILHGMITA